MLVGIYLSSGNAETGGEYTIQREILFSLYKIAKFSKHKYILFSPVLLKELTDTSYFKTIVIPKDVIPILNISEIIHKLNNIARRLFGLSPKSQKPNNIQKTVYESKPDLIYLLSPFDDLNVEIPYIITVWDLQHRLQPFFPEVSKNNQYKNREAFYNEKLKRATYIITGNNAGKKELERFYGIFDERIKLLPHPTPSHLLKDDNIVITNILEKNNLKKNTYLFYPAQYWPHKNHINLIYALNELIKKHNTSVKMVFVGSNKGNLEYIKSKVKELSLDEYVHFLGFVENHELIELYRNALALTYLSFFGPENLPPLEAFTLDCPVIAAKVRGSEDQLGEAALLVNPENPEEIANAVLKIINNPDLKMQLCKLGKKRALSYTGKEFVYDLFSLFDEFEPIRRTWKTNSSNF